MTQTAHIGVPHSGFHTITPYLAAQDVGRPASPLTPFVELFWLYESYAPRRRTERILPTGAVELVIDLQGTLLHMTKGQHSQHCQSFRSAIVYGPHTEGFDIDPSQRTALLGLHFKPGGAFPFFPIPVEALQNQHAMLNDLWGAAANDLIERVSVAPTPQAAFRLVEQALLAQAVRPLALHPAVTFALNALQRGPHSPSIAAITRHTGLSPRHFSQLFRDQVGLTPKRFSRIQRFQSVLCHIHMAQQVNWADVALAWDYFDQAHFVHDFRALSGLTPSQYLEYRTSQRNHIVLDT